MKLLGPEQVAEILGVSRSTARRMMIEGNLPVIPLRAGKRKKILRVAEESLERWLRSRERQETSRTLRVAQQV
jgi:excisionase family DNA binding protein